MCVVNGDGGLCFAVLVGYFVGINALGQVHPDLPSTIHGFEWAIPVALVDALAGKPSTHTTSRIRS